MRLSQSSFAVDHGEDRRHLRRHQVVAGVGATARARRAEGVGPGHAVLEGEEDRHHDGVRVGSRGFDRGRLRGTACRWEHEKSKGSQTAEPPLPRSGSEALAGLAPCLKASWRLRQVSFLVVGSCRGHIDLPTCLRRGQDFSCLRLTVIAARSAFRGWSGGLARGPLQDRAEHIGYFGKFGHSNKSGHREEDERAHHEADHDSHGVASRGLSDRVARAGSRRPR